MFKFFSSNPKKKLKKAYEQKLTAAMQAQRNGDIRSYSTLSEEADRLLRELHTLETGKNQTDIL